MAVAFDAVGPSSAGAGNTSTTSLSWTHPSGAVANRVILACCSLDAPTDTGLTMSATCAGVTMTSLGIVHSNSGTSGYLQVWGLTGVGTGTLAIAVTVTGGTPGDLEGGSLSFSGAAGFGTPATGVSAGTTSTATAALAANTNGNLIAGFAAAGDSILSATAPSTSRFIKNQAGGAGNSTGNAAGATSPATGSSVTMAWALNSATFFAEILVEVLPAVPLPSPPAPVLPPGWFPGSDRAVAVPGGIPFNPLPGTTDATPAVIFPSLPEAAAVQNPLLPPGWFPGADRAATEPGGIPFYAQPGPADPSQAILPPPAPDSIGIADWLPLPPGYFPGSQTVTIDPGGIPFYSQPQPLNPPPAPVTPPFITGLGGSGYNSWFTDSAGAPRLMLLEQAWLLPSNGGRWNGGNWQSDIDTYFTIRAKQGYNAWYGIAWNNTHIDSTALSGGRTWDGIYPLNINGTPGAIATGAETITLNDPFWRRIDYLFRSAAGQGITCFFNISQSYDISSATGVWHFATNAQGTAFGTALATRYPQAAFPNVQWFFGDDDDGPNDSFYQAILTAMQAAGDTRPLISDEQFTNTNCHIEFDNKTAFGGTFGVPNSTYNWVYSYDAPYFGVEDSYTEGGTFSHIVPVYGDGVYYGDLSGQSNAVIQREIRSFTWWALASGARGVCATSGPSDIGGTGLWLWTSGAVAALTSDPNGTFCTSSIGAITGYLTSLADWNKLIPDTGNVFITAGRGTRGTCDPPGGTFNLRTGNNYVCGSVTPAGTLAVVYCKAAMSITIDQTKLANPASYTATWVDPLTLATQSAGTGSTYNSTPLGNNSAGDPDWVLVFQSQPPAGAPSISFTAPVAPGWFPGADRVTAVPGGIPFAQVPAPTDQNAPAGAPALNVSAGLATGTGTAQAPVVAIGVNDTAGPALGTGTAQQPLAAAAANAALASGTGAAQGDDVNGTFTPAAGANAALTTGTGTAQQPVAAIAANDTLATGTGTAQPPVPAVAVSDTLATATGTAQSPLAAVAVNAGLATGTGAALDATVSTTGGAASPALETFAFGSFPQIPPGSVITSVTVVINQWQSTATMGAPSYQLWDGTSAQIGATQAGTVSTSPDHEDQATFTGITYSQLGTLRVRTFASQGGSSSGAVAQVGWVSLVVTFTPAGNATAAPAILAASAGFPQCTVSAGETVPAAVLNATAGFPQCTAGLLTASAFPAVLSAIAGFPQCTASGVVSASAAPAILAATAAFPQCTAGLLAASVSPAVLNAFAGFPQCAASGVTNAAAAPAVLAATAAVPQCSAGLLAATALPALLNAIAGFPPATASGVVNASLAPAILAAAAAVPACLVIASSTGPDYAGNADVLAGGTGTWTGPAGATGPPDPAEAAWTVP